jgi:energy-coupling factor transporter ATP-binding protein EcfA2/uncharacterized protein YlbG (UPF0298 family)
MENVAVFESVSYEYPKSSEPVLKKIDLLIEKGKFTVIMGPSGAGKTTMLLCLNGLIPQLLEGVISGKITVLGRDVSKYRVQTLVRSIGLVLQDAETQIFGRTVEEDTAFGPRNFSVPKKELFERVDEALARVRLTGYRDRDTEELSGGEKQRLAIAGVLAMRPDILVLDEPTSELDPIGREEIYRTITDLKKEKNLTIIGVEHSSQEIVEKADQIVILNNGEICWNGTPQDLFRNLELLNRYGIKPIPVAKIGWYLYQKKKIEYGEIPLNIDTMEDLIRKLLNGRKIKNVQSSSIQTETEYEADSANQRKTLICIQNLSHKYDSGKIALHEICLNVFEGEFVALIGQNGAGKTTLAKHLNGLLMPTTGSIIVNDKNTKEYETSVLSQDIGYVFQNPDHQIFSSTVQEELEYGLKNIGISEAEMKKRIDEVLEFTKLTKCSNAHPFSLGKGERQMIAVASILALQPKILVVDEPTTGQDWEGINRMMELFQVLHQRGTTIIMISHDMDIVAKYAQRVIVMKNGSVLLDGKAKEVFSQVEVLRDAYVTPTQISLLSNRIRDLGLSEIISDEAEFAQMIIAGMED